MQPHDFAVFLTKGLESVFLSLEPELHLKLALANEMLVSRQGISRAGKQQQQQKNLLHISGCLLLL
jgi:hypothetical protein